MTPYQDLESRYRRMGLLQDTLSVLSWDTATMMPEGSAEARAEQTATLEVLLHGLAVDPAIGDLLTRADGPSLDDWQRANLAEMRRGYLHATAVPERLVEARSRATSDCEIAWRAARPANDFPGLLPKLREVLVLTREVAAVKAEALGCSPYDALLDQYEPGGRSADIDLVFADLAGFLPAFTEKVLAHQAGRPAPLPLAGSFPLAAQRALGRRMMAAVGFEFDRGRLDVSHHPFCGGTPDDIRITTRYAEEDFSSALMGVLHETGHALYERGLPAAWRHQPVGSARGMSLHESQSLLIEMQACRSLEFARFAAPLIRAAFDLAGPVWEPENLYRNAIRVERGLIRVDADEVTYPAHVILRYRLERQLIDGGLDLADLPEAWRAGMAELVGAVPSDDRDGCLQDVHWPSGAFGYFPTYTLGAMTAAQLFAAARAAVPGLASSLELGDFRPLLGWLREHVHSQGSRFGTTEVITRATGRPLGTEAYRHHLEQRYLS